jgi:hypothetical protein
MCATTLKLETDMKSLKLVVIAASALGLSGPAFAGRDEAQLQQQAQAVKKLRAEPSRTAAGGASAARAGTPAKPLNIGHPTERVRR